MSSFQQAIEHLQIPSIEDDMGQKSSKGQCTIWKCTFFFKGIN